MKSKGWMYWLVVAAVVVLAGAVVAAAEERIEVKVENRDGNEVKVDINGVTEVIRLDDLEEGESRTFDLGDHTMVVTRVGDHLMVGDNVHTFDALGDAGGALDTLVWVDGEGDPMENKKVIVMRRDGDGSGESTYTVQLDGDDIELDGNLDVEVEELTADGPHAIFITDGGDGKTPVVLKTAMSHAGMVRYRCEETGSELLVPKDKAFSDSYICPATGCVMTRVDEPEVKVIKIRKKVESGDE